MAQDCVFCKINAGEIPSEVLYRDNCFVIRDIAPKAPVHLLIIPAQHFTYLSGLTQGFTPAIGSMFMAAKEMAKREGLTDSGYRLIVNHGQDSGQEVPHLHMHLLGGKRLGAIA
jgi:histidine triad (HIT) family protein